MPSSIICPKCAEVFLRKGMFDKHCCVHPCTFCAKTFPRKYNREVHEKTCKVKLAMGMGDMKQILLEVQVKLRTLERAHGNQMKQVNAQLKHLKARNESLSGTVNSQGW